MLKNGLAAQKINNTMYISKSFLGFTFIKPP